MNQFDRRHWNHFSARPQPFALGHYANGVELNSPGSRSASWVCGASRIPTPTGLHNACPPTVVEPFQGSWSCGIPPTQGAPKRRPWAIECNPVGVNARDLFRVAPESPVISRRHRLGQEVHFGCLYANGVAFVSPRSRSAPWVCGRIPHSYPNGGCTRLNPRRTSRHRRPEAVRLAERAWRIALGQT